MPSKAMLHTSTTDRDRLNALAKQEGIGQQEMLTRVIDAYLRPPAAPAPAAPPVATPAINHRPLLIFGKGASLRIDSQARPYIALANGQQWQRLEFGKVVQPWE